MLIRFHVSNFLSFDEEVELSMIPGRARQHPNHVIRGTSRNDTSVLRMATVYGANASGKSNLIKAMAFARRLILAGTHANETISRQPFKLSHDGAKLPSKIEFEFKTETNSYIYGFSLTPKRIHEEWLYKFRKTTDPAMIYERSTTLDGHTSVDFGKIKLDNKEDMGFLNYVVRGTRSNQLFLTETLEKNVELFEDIYQWFGEKLTIIFPQTSYRNLGDVKQDQQLSTGLVEYLMRFDTGINGITLEEADPMKVIPKALVDDMVKSSQGKPTSISVVGPQERFFVEISDDGEIIAHRLMLKHEMCDSDSEVSFEMKEESDGTQRLLDLIPLLLLAESDRVFVIDELERSLHPNLSRKFVELFLRTNNDSQLILTTHESTLLDLDLLRRDEIWFIEKDRSGASSVYSLEEYKPRYDKDIEKGYLLGRFGAIPVIDHNF